MFILFVVTLLDAATMCVGTCFVFRNFTFSFFVSIVNCLLRLWKMAKRAVLLQVFTLNQVHQLLLGEM